MDRNDPDHASTRTPADPPVGAHRDATVLLGGEEWTMRRDPDETDAEYEARRRLFVEGPSTEDVRRGQ